MPDLFSPKTEPAPSAWVSRWAAQIPSGGKVLDLACGSGRHTRYLRGQGFTLVAVDRDLSACADLQGRHGVQLRQADLENGAWPCPGEQFDGVVVTNYLYRPLFPQLLESVASGGILIYETFALGNEQYGRPRNPNFLLLPGELLELVRGRFRVIAYEDVLLESPSLARVQRICASG